MDFFSGLCVSVSCSLDALSYVCLCVFMFTLAATHFALWYNNMFELELSETLQTPLVRAAWAVFAHVFMVWDLALSYWDTTGQSVLVIQSHAKGVFALRGSSGGTSQTNQTAN